MFALVVDLLTGRYGATAYNQRDVFEWPPHPGRLYSALVAAWGDNDEPDGTEYEALQWLEAQGAPQLTCSSPKDEIAPRRALTHYVPVNDPTVLRGATDAKHEAVVAATAVLADAQASGAPTKRAENALRKATSQYQAALANATAASGRESASVVAKALRVLPENRNRQGRSYPSVTPDDPRVWFCWPDANPAHRLRATLDALASRVGRLGHSATFVSCCVADDPPPPTLVPGFGNAVLRVPGRGLLKALEREHLHRNGRSDRDRALPRLEMRYGTPEAAEVERVSGVLAGDWIVLTLEADLRSARPTQIRNTRSVELARALRDALVTHSDAEATEFITGRWADDIPRPHLAVVPLSSVGHRMADGTVRGVALMLPRDADDRYRVAVEHAVAEWGRAGFDVTLPGVSDNVRLTFSGARLAPHYLDDTFVEASYALRRSRWCASARTWTSVTPVVLDRFVKGLHDKHGNVSAAADAKAQDIIARACEHYGLPRPEDVVISPVGMTAGVPPTAGRRRSARAFPPYVAAGSGQRRQSVHVSVTFAEAVAGPVLLGAGRYLGYGVFVPHRDPRQSGGESHG